MSKYEHSNAMEIYARLHTLLKQPVISTIDDDGNVEDNSAPYSRIAVVIDMCDAFRTGNIRFIAYGENPYIAACLPNGVVQFGLDNGKVTQKGVKLQLEHGKHSCINWADFTDRRSSYHEQTEQEIRSNIYSIDQAVSDIHKIIFDALEGLNPILAKLLWVDEDDGRMDKDMAEHKRRWDWIAHPGQKRGEKQNQLLLGGFGSGKSRALHEDAIAFAWDNPGSNIAIVDPWFNTSRASMLGEVGIITLLPESVKTHRGFKTNSHNMTVELPNGSVFRFYNDENPDALRGHVFHYVGMSDIQLWKNFQTTYDHLELCLRGKGPNRMMIACTPKPMAIIKAICTGQVSEWDVTRVNTAENIHNLGKAAQEYIKNADPKDTVVYDGPVKSGNSLGEASDGEE